MFFSRQNGSTLIEIVVSLSLLSILATFLIEFVNTGIKGGSSSLLALKQQIVLSQIMEKMTADYKWILLTDADPLETFKKRIENGNNPSHTPYFGEYRINTKYIEFSQDGLKLNEKADPCFTDCKILKVSIDHGSHRLIAIFTR